MILLQKRPREGANQAYRHFLGVCKKHPLGAASSARNQLNMIMFWIHLLQTDNERMVKKVYNECKSLTDNHNQRTGCGKLKASLLNVG